MTTANTTKKYYYLVITVYPLIGKPYPKVFLSNTHPLEHFSEYEKNAMALPLKVRPFRVTLTFFHEIPGEYYHKQIAKERAQAKENTQ